MRNWNGMNNVVVSIDIILMGLVTIHMYVNLHAFIGPKVHVSLRAIWLIQVYKHISFIEND